MAAVRGSVAAAMAVAGYLFVVVVVALRRGVVFEFAGEKTLHRFVDGAADAGDELYARRREDVLRAAADAAADEQADAVLVQEAAERGMAAAFRVDYLPRRHRAVLDLIEREVARMSKMLENLSVIFRYRYYSAFHDRFHPFPESLAALADKGAAPASGHAAAPLPGDLIIAAVDEDALARAERFRDLGVRGIDDALQRAARNAHPTRRAPQGRKGAGFQAPQAKDRVSPRRPRQA